MLPRRKFAGIEEIERNLDIVSDLSRDALKGTRAGRESADLALIARVMSTLKHERAAQIRASIEAVAPAWLAHDRPRARYDAYRHRAGRASWR